MENTEIKPYDDVLSILEAEFSMIQKRDEAKPELANQWLVEWYLGKRQQNDDMRDAIKKRAKELLDHCDAIDRALAFRWGEDFKNHVDAMLEAKNAGAKKPTKSIKMLTGTAGYRTLKPKLVIEDKAKVIDWAITHLTNDELKMAVSGVNVGPLSSHVAKKEEVNQDTGEAVEVVVSVPSGCRWEEGSEKFYPEPPTKSLLESKPEAQGELPNGNE